MQLMQQMLVRTMIYNISSNKWDDKILNLLKIKKHILPEVKIVLMIMDLHILL